MEKVSFVRRFVYPVAVVVGILVISKVLYEYSWYLDNDTLHQGIAFVSGAVHVLILWLGSLIIYPWAFVKGASIKERVVACFIPPVAWTIGEIIRVTEFFTLGESLYYGLNSQFLVSCAMTVFLMGLLELICRRWLKTQIGTASKVVSIGPILAMLAGIGGIYVFLIWGVGVHWFYVYQQGYKALFH